MNIPGKKDVTPHSLDDIKNSCAAVYGGDGELIEICSIAKELEQGINAISAHPRVATIYGSARLHPDHPAYIAAEELAYRLVSEAGYAIMTGGAGGIMAAGNHGANRAGGVSLGSTIRLNHEQHTNPDVTEAIPFEYFFTRKTVLRYGSECAIFCTGGFGTFDELFELLTLLQTNKIQKMPVILFGTEFWKPLDDYIRATLLTEFQTIASTDTELYIITDNVDLVVEAAKAAPTKHTESINE